MKWFKEIFKQFLGPFFFSTRAPSHAVLAKAFFDKPEHRWILRNPNLRSALIELFSELPAETLKVLFVDRKLLLHFCSDRMSSNFYQYPNRNIILLFPDLIKLMGSARRDLGKAILLHELGHVFHGHGQRSISQINAQFEADHFAFTMGFGLELAEALTDQMPHTEVPPRVNALLDLCKNQRAQ